MCVCMFVCERVTVCVCEREGGCKGVKGCGGGEEEGRREEGRRWSRMTAMGARRGQRQRDTARRYVMEFERRRRAEEQWTRTRAVGK